MFYTCGIFWISSLIVWSPHDTVKCVLKLLLIAQNEVSFKELKLKENASFEKSCFSAWSLGKSTHYP